MAQLIKWIHLLYEEVGNATDKRRESRERDGSRREALGKFFYDLAKFTFATMVLGSTRSLFMEYAKVNY